MASNLLHKKPCKDKPPTNKGPFFTPWQTRIGMGNHLFQLETWPSLHYLLNQFDHPRMARTSLMSWLLAELSSQQYTCEFWCSLLSPCQISRSNTMIPIHNYTNNDSNTYKQTNTKKTFGTRCWMLGIPWRDAKIPRKAGTWPSAKRPMTMQVPCTLDIVTLVPGTFWTKSSDGKDLPKNKQLVSGLEKWWLED